MTELTTARLHMRPFTDGDDHDLARLHGDADLMAHMRDGVQSRAETAAELARYRECWAAHGFGVWALFAEKVFVGECGLRLRLGDSLGNTLVDDQGVWLRFVIDKPYWGRGFAGEAVEASLGFAFETAAIGRIRAAARERNPAALRVLERAGMTVEKCTRTEQGDEIRLYAITAEAWAAKRSAS